MILRSIRIREFKNVGDSGEVRIEGDVTCLVGKNESGKSAVLQALYRLNPLSTGHPETFVGLRDYPRRRYARDKDRVPAARPVTATFELEDEDVRAVEDACGEGVLASRLVTVSRTYENELVWAIDCRGESDAENGGPIALSDPGDPGDPSDLDDLGGPGEPGDPSTDDGESEPPDPDLEFLESLEFLEPLESQVRGIVESRLPGFLYFDEYSVMPGRVSIPALQEAGDGRALEPGERTALSLMRLAGVDAADFTSDDYEARRASLEAVGNQLADEVFEYWSQNRDLSVEFDIDYGGREPDPRAPFIDVRIRNRRHGISLNFNERSQGFTWFFSFLAAFSEFRRRERTILLLDEPGLGLHASGQDDLLRFIDERLAPAHQVVYSTHSPFMVAPASLRRVRTVEDKGQDGSRVSHDFLDSSRDTRIPLQAALGFDLVRTVLTGPCNLLVERPSDHVFLTVMSGLLERRGRARLDPRWTVVPAGGLVGVSAAVALLGAGSRGAVVVDLSARNGRVNDSAPDPTFDSPAGRKMLAEHKVVGVEDFAPDRGADIEDLFADDFYLDLVNRSGAAAVERFEIAGGGSIVERIETVTGTGFNRYLPARLLLESRAAELSEAMDDETLDRFEALFREINGFIPARKPGGGVLRSEG